MIKKAAAEFPAVVLTGPRQSGKPSLLKRLFAGRYRHVSLEPPDVRAAAVEDSRSFLDMQALPEIFDEAQHAPELLPYVKEWIDAAGGVSGQVVLTGSCRGASSIRGMFGCLWVRM